MGFRALGQAIAADNPGEMHVEMLGFGRYGSPGCKLAGHSVGVSCTGTLEDVLGMNILAFSISEGTDIKSAPEKRGSEAEAGEAHKKQRAFSLPAGAEVVPNPGRGDCLFHALAQALSAIEKKERGHRSIRGAVGAWMADNCSFLEPFWDHLDCNDLAFSGTFLDYVNLVKKCGSRAGYLEIFALCRGHGLNVLVLTSSASHRFKGRAETDPYVVLKLDAAHYEWIRMDSVRGHCPAVATGCGWAHRGWPGRWK